jgi:hypothetical protein
MSLATLQIITIKQLDPGSAYSSMAPFDVKFARKNTGLPVAAGCIIDDAQKAVPELDERISEQYCKPAHLNFSVPIHSSLT